MAVCWLALVSLELNCVLVLVEKITVAMHIYTHTAADSAWSYAVRVERNARATRVQELKNVATAQRSSILKQTCGTLQNGLPT